MSREIKAFGLDILFGVGGASIFSDSRTGDKIDTIVYARYMRSDRQ